MQKNFWTHKSVLITGSSGFIGTYLRSRLTEAGADVVGISRRPASPQELKVDLTNYSSVENIFAKYHPSVCFHLAGASIVEVGQREPYKTFHNNLTSSLNILELCRQFGVSRLVLASTVHVYGDASTPYKEDEPARPSRPYETSKTAVDLIAQSYADSFQLPVVIGRFVNIYGPGDLNFSRVIPKTIQSILQGRRPTMWGGNSQREYLYIDDAIDAYVRLAQLSDAKVERNRIYNFGTGKPVSVSRLMRQIITLSGSAVSIRQTAGGRPEELTKQLASFEKARRVFGWRPRTSLAVGLAQTLSWYKVYFGLK